MFERYTEQARRAIFFARLVARHQGAERITPAHLLAGLTWEGKTRADAVGSLKDNAVDLWSAVGIPHLPTAARPYLGMSEPDISLNQDGKKALAHAADEAKRDWQYWIDTDHLLRGLLRSSNEASDAIQSLPLDLETARAASKRHRAEFKPQRTPFLRAFGPPSRSQALFFVKLAAFLLAVFLAILVVRWIN